jgi:Arc/MetJ-type ribon-helix-helix transcriptional regulator
MVQLTDSLLAELDRQAARLSTSRSALIRRAVEDFLKRDREAQAAREIVEGYKRIPPATPDEWGDLAGVTDGATVDVLHRLDAEERSQGHEPW